MRTLVALLIAFALGGAFAWVLLRSGPTPELRPPNPRVDPDLDAHPYLLVKTGTLVIRVQAPDGTVPFGAEVGYEHEGVTRFLYAGEDGVRKFADAPLGDIFVLGRAPGYETARVPRRILAGVPDEVRIVLTPKG